MILKKFLFFIFFIILLSTSSQAFANNKTVYLNIDFLIDNSNFGKDILDYLNNINTKNIKELSQKEKEIKELDEGISKVKNVISNKELETKVNDLKKKIKKYNIYKKELSIELSELKKKNIKVFFEKIKPLVQKYMNDNSIDIIIDKKNIFIARTDYDITEDILKIINAKLVYDKIK